jgi:hypothetical protein
MTSIAASFGAPVTEPGGNSAATSAPSPTSWRRRPRISLTRCQTPACGRTSASAVTTIDPGSLTRPRSLRIRSTIMTFSARSFAAPASSARCASAPSASAGRGRVPLIGAVRTVSPVRATNSSGDRLATAPHGPASHAARSGASAATPRVKRSTASPSSSACRRSDRLAWKRSPAAIRSRQASTARAWAAGDGFARQGPDTTRRGPSTPAATRDDSSSRRRSSSSARASLHSASNHHRPSASHRSRWS